jgi:hypothetical protein
LTIAALAFLWSLRRRIERRWLAVFVVFYLVGASLAVAPTTAVVLSQYPVDTRPLNWMLVHVFAGSVLLGAIAILTAIIGDQRAGVAGDGLHRLGLVTWLANAATQMVTYANYLAL